MRRALEALAWGLAVALAGIVATSLDPVAGLEQDFELRWLFHLRGATVPPPDVVVVAIDEDSARNLGVPDKPNAWPRGLHARLIDRLAQAGARVICFDLTFESPGRAPQDDADLAAAIRRAGNVVLTDALMKETRRQTDDAARAGSSFEIERISPPLPIFERAALSHAPFPLPRQLRVDAYWTFKSGTGDAPTLPVVAFQVFAFDAYRPFLDLLRRTVPDARITAPDSPSALLASGASQGLTDALRGVFLRVPRIGERMSEEVERAGEADLPPAAKRLVRSLLDLYRGNEVAYLNLRGPPRTVTTVPYDQVLGRPGDAATGRPAADFRGKAVFVGFSARSPAGQDRIRDDYQTVFSDAGGLNLSGVEIAATAFADLLDDRPVRPATSARRLAIIGLAGAALGALARMLRPVTACALVLVAGAAYLLIALHEFSTTATWLPLLLPLGAQAPLALFGGVMINYREARRQRARMRQAVGYYLPSRVVDQLLENVGPVPSADQLIHGACLATDLEKYTSLAENMPPKELVRLMNEYYAQLFKPVERFGGVVNNVAGDAMLAIWVASSSRPPAGPQACLAALEIAEALQRFNRAVPGGPVLWTRLGLHSGQMLLGSVGASRHYQYEAMGDMVNTASRIQGLGKYLGAQILASEAAADGLHDVLKRPVGAFLMTGKSTPVAVVELLGHAQQGDARLASLCEQFAEALDLYRTRRWRDAAGRLSEILQMFPQDGPSHFYLQRCQDHLLHPPDFSWSPMVRLDQK